ncbi:MAG: ABC transporter ATP-binding protein [Chitinophagaceae bacterium]|nr:MAG: ABC transporter ATP-binding protein [Chitinophagaceae bacterium]
MTGDPAVNVSNLEFTYRDQPGHLFNKLNLKIEKGESFGLFGPNGAGKTTLMSIMTGLIPYTGGSVNLLGQEIKTKPKEFNKRFGFVPQDFSFYHELTPLENLEFFGAWAGLSKTQIKQRSTDLLNVLGLTSVGNKQVEKFSGGMKRRVNLAISVIHQPEILFLDEPTVGVDVQSRFAIIDYLKQLNQEGMTLVYTSHQLHEAETLCRKIAMIDEGRIIVHDTLQNLLNTHQQDGLEGLFLTLTGKSYRD